MSLHCKQCQETIAGRIGYEHGDWIVVCERCSAKNIFAFRSAPGLDPVEIEIIGYR